VRRKTTQGITKNIIDLIQNEYEGKCGIIYCLSRQTCENVAKNLREAGITAKHYHADMSAEDRSAVQQEWQAGEIQVIVATIAFGMGIDKPDVRFVIHHALPKSLEGYFQETGRAGRDGKRSGCYLYYATHDAAKIHRMINESNGTAEQQARQHEMLKKVTKYCHNDTDCRRVQLLAYFNERFRIDDCNRSCDVCKAGYKYEVRDFTKEAMGVISLVRRFGKANVTMSCAADVYRGSGGRHIKPYAKLEEFGMGSHLGRDEIGRLFDHLLDAEALYEESVVTHQKFTTEYVRLGRNAEACASGRRRLRYLVRVDRELNTAVPRPAKKKAGTGVCGVLEEDPQSTNVSSPLQNISRRQNASKSGASFTANLSEDDEDSDGFEPIREAGKPARSKRRDIGPPITNDGSPQDSDDPMCIIRDSFLLYAKDVCRKVRSFLQPQVICLLGCANCIYSS
jgi:bloom syndrome protein